MYVEILKAVNDKLKTLTPQIPITSSDETDGIERPSFMVDLENINQQAFMNSYKDSEFDVNIKYFASSREKSRIENLKMIEQLSELFIENNLLNCEDYAVEIYDAIEIKTVDSVLHFTIPIFISEFVDKEKEFEEMETLEFEMKGAMI